MDPTTSKLKINAANAYKMASNYVMVIASGMFAWYLALPVVCAVNDATCSLSQHAIQDWVSTTLHIPALVVPILTGMLGVVARIWPQKSISPAEAAAKSADAPQPPTT